MPAPTAVPADRPLTRHLNDALTTWSTSQRTVIGLSADASSAQDDGADARISRGGSGGPTRCLAVLSRKVAVRERGVWPDPTMKRTDRAQLPMTVPSSSRRISLPPALRGR